MLVYYSRENDSAYVNDGLMAQIMLLETVQPVGSWTAMFRGSKPKSRSSLDLDHHRCVSDVNFQDISILFYLPLRSVTTFICPSSFVLVYDSTRAPSICDKTSRSISWNATPYVTVNVFK